MSRCSPPRRSRSSPTSSGASTRAGSSCSSGASRCRRGWMPASALALPPRDREGPRGRLEGRADPADLQDRRVEITGPVDRKMVINALNSGANVLHGGLRGLATRRPGRNVHRRPDQPARRGPPARSTFTSREGQAVPAEREDRDALRPPARLAPRREARRWSTARPMLGSLFDFGLFFFHNAQGAARPRHRPVLLPAEAGEPPRGAAVERRLRLRAAGARHPARHDPAPRC